MSDSAVDKASKTKDIEHKSAKKQNAEQALVEKKEDLDGTHFGVPSWATDWSLYRDPGMGLGAGRGPAICRQFSGKFWQSAGNCPAGKSENSGW